MPPAILIMWGVSLGPPAPRYRGAVIIVLTVAVPLTPLGVENFVRRQIIVFPFPLYLFC